jgi:hypothetical protein
MRYFIQHDSSPDAVNCLKLAAPWHRAYAERHELEYIEDYQKCSAVPYSANSEGQVWFFKLLKKLPLGAEVLYADADVLIAKPEVDVLKEILPDGVEISMLGGQHTWVNSGVVGLFNTPNLQKWFDYLMRIGPIAPKTEWPFGNTFIDHRFIHEFGQQCAVSYKFFDDRFNWFPTYQGALRTVLWKEKDVIVKAWHGTEAKERIKKMRTELEALMQVA